jgi:dihydroflavonol-4-reductase
LPQLGKPLKVSNAKAKQLMGMNFIPADVTLRESADYLIKNGFIKSSGDDGGGDDAAFLATIA